MDLKCRVLWPVLPKLAFAAFDVLDSDTVAADASWEAKFDALEKWLGQDTAAHAVVHHKVDSRSAFTPFFNDHVTTAGAEVVVRHESGPTYKIKLALTSTLLFGVLRDLTRQLVACGSYLSAMSDGAFQVIGQVGNGLTQAQQVEAIHFPFRGSGRVRLPRGLERTLAFTMVSPQYVVQIRCIDILSESSKDPFEKRCFNGKSSMSMQDKAAVSLISPVFEGLRSDKSAGAADASFTQIERWLSKDQKMIQTPKLRRPVPY